VTDGDTAARRLVLVLALVRAPEPARRPSRGVHELPPGGTYEYSYVARATTPGRFVAPPARAEELFAPEVFGRSATATVVVE
jgi:hypothetical protein